MILEESFKRFVEFIKNPPSRDDYTLAPLHDESGERNMGEHEIITDGFGVEITSVKVSDSPWPPNPIGAASESWKRTKQRLEAFMRSCNIAAPIDEVAVMFHSEQDKARWIRDAVSEKNVKHFNSADDTVHTSPIPRRYSVEYDFLEVNGLGMRVEAMYIDRGSSPLHDSLLELGGNPTVQHRPDIAWNAPIAVHFSFKVAKAEYEIVRAAMVAGGATLVQACDSTYGRFSYYRVPEEQGGTINVYLKPRINTRDPETELPSTGRSGEFGHPGVGSRYSAEAQGLRPIKDAPQA